MGSTMTTHTNKPTTKFLVNLFLVMFCSGLACWSWLKGDDYHAVNNFESAYLWYGYGGVMALLGIALLKREIIPGDNEFSEWVSGELLK